MPRVLIMDDEPQVLKLYRSVFEDETFEVLTAKTVAEALALHREQAPNVIVADASMRDGGAIELLRRIGATCPVLVTTGGDTENIAAAARHMGAVGVFQKVDGPLALVSAVERVLAPWG